MLNRSEDGGCCIELSHASLILAIRFERFPPLRQNHVAWTS